MNGTDETPNRNVKRGEATRARILDAAEVLFSQRGYDGTSMRDLAELAGVRMSLVHYHCGAKEQVLATAIDRKLDDLLRFVRGSFDEARSAARLKTVEDCVRAFIVPFLAVTADKDHELHNFVTMTSHLMSSYRIPEVKPSLMRLSAISEVFTTHLRLLRPDADQPTLLAGVYFIEAALVFMVQDPGFLDDLSASHHSSDNLDSIAESALTFFSAGLRALIGPTSQIG